MPTGFEPAGFPSRCRHWRRRRDGDLRSCTVCISFAGEHDQGLARGKAGIAYAIPAANGVQIDRDNEVILARYQDAMYAFNLSCPHQRTALRWNDVDKQFQCPKHHSKYDPKGDFISGRATRGMDRLAITRQGANVVVDIDQMYKEDEDTPKWTTAFVKLS